MPRYFFDLEGEPLDDTGFDLPHVGAAQRAVQMSLPHLLAERGRSDAVTLVMRSETNAIAPSCPQRSR